MDNLTKKEFATQAGLLAAVLGMSAMVTLLAGPYEVNPLNGETQESSATEIQESLSQCTLLYNDASQGEERPTGIVQETSLYKCPDDSEIGSLHGRFVMAQRLEGYQGGQTVHINTATPDAEGAWISVPDNFQFN